MMNFQHIGIKNRKKNMWTRKEMNLIFLTISMKKSTETSYSNKTIFISSLLWSHVHLRKPITFRIFVKTKGTIFLYFMCEPVLRITELMCSFVHFFFFFFYNRFAIILAHKIYIKLKVFTKIQFYVLLENDCIVTLEIFWIKIFLVHKTNIMSEFHPMI